MRFGRPLITYLLAILTVTLFAQTPADPKHRSSIEMVRDIATLLSKHFPTKAEMRAGADQVAREYSSQLKTVHKKVQWLASEADSRFKEMAWHDKLNLVMELWRIRESLDLMKLCSPDVLANFGITVPDLKTLADQFTRAESHLKQLLP